MEKIMDTMQYQNKKVGFLLGLGILLFPLIFAWFTLRQGYSTFARVVSFVWLILCLIAGLTVNPYFNFYSMSMNLNSEPTGMIQPNENLNTTQTATTG
jgi:hypothetical protein